MSKIIFTILAVMKKNNFHDGEAQNSFSNDDDDVSGTPPLPPTDAFAPLSSNSKKLSTIITLFLF
jgi:hypothetical protein